MGNSEHSKTAYSENELLEFRQIIQSKLTEAQKEYDFLISELKDFNHNGTDDTNGSSNVLEDGSDTSIKEEISMNAGRLKKFIENLNAAIFRIENKTYGICRVTGNLIPRERLIAVPHTTQTIEAKLNNRK